MKTTEEKQRPNLHSPGSMAKPINFYCNAPNAQSVLLQGDFTNWTPLAMQRREFGWWFLQVPLTHGHHQYRFLVDGQPRLDPRAAGVIRKEGNQEVSVIAVS